MNWEDSGDQEASISLSLRCDGADGWSHWPVEILGRAFVKTFCSFFSHFFERSFHEEEIDLDFYTVAEDDFKILTFLPPSPQCWDHRHAPPHPTI